MVEDMERKMYVPSHDATLVKTKPVLQNITNICMKVDCHLVAAADMQNDSDSTTLSAVNPNGESTSLDAEPRRMLGGAAEAEAVAGTEQATEHSSKQQQHHVHTDSNEQQQHVHGEAASTQIEKGSAMNENSACAQNQNLLMLGVGKHKLKAAHYTFEPKELLSIADETRTFSRDGF